MKKEIPPGRPAPPEIARAVIDLAKLCAAHNFPLDIPKATECVTDQMATQIGSLEAMVALQKNVIESQKKVIERQSARIRVLDNLDDL